LLLTEIENISDVEEIAGRIIALFHEPFVLGENVVSVTTSIGIALYPDHGLDAETLLRNADAAMYGVKGDGRCNYAVCRAAG
jgi:diguanylate cyclase (GGDEF)-like protein